MYIMYIYKKINLFLHSYIYIERERTRERGAAREDLTSKLVQLRR
jgi:hypothetical protein